MAARPEASPYQEVSGVWPSPGVALGGNGLTREYGIAAAVTASKLARIAPVSREMVLNFVAQTSLGLPRSY